ncbi:MAG: hypothetical protein M3Q88_07085 [Pseudomonadota bacterium]|nr:hypothetical protein [Pseudomonadota bacterium]
MSIVRVACGLLLIVPAAAAAQSMNAERFHQRSSALMAKGPMALFSRGEIKALMSEVQNAGRAARALRLADAAAAAGRPARSCPPAKQSMESSEFMRRLGAIPLAERSTIDMTEAMIRISAARFPCPR